MGGNTPKTYVDYRELLADPSIDAVFIMTPEHLHYSMAMAAIKAGKHIYLEKPIAHTIEEGAAIVKASEQSGKILQVGTQNRSNPHYQKAKEMVEQGMIGEVHYVRAFWYRNFPSADHSGALALRHSRRMPASPTPTGTGSSGPPASGPSTSTATSSGATTGTTRAASPPICWSTRPTPPTSSWARRCPSTAWLRRHLLLGTARRPRSARHAQRHLRVPGQVPSQLQLLLPERSVRLRRAVHGTRGHHRGAEPQRAALLPAVVDCQRRFPA